MKPNPSAFGGIFQSLAFGHYLSMEAMYDW